MPGYLAGAGQVDSVRMQTASQTFWIEWLLLCVRVYLERFAYKIKWIHFYTAIHERKRYPGGQPYVAPVTKTGWIPFVRVWISRHRKPDQFAPPCVASDVSTGYFHALRSASPQVDCDLEQCQTNHFTAITIGRGVCSPTPVSGAGRRPSRCPGTASAPATRGSGR